MPQGKEACPDEGAYFRYNFAVMRREFEVREQGARRDATVAIIAAVAALAAWSLAPRAATGRAKDDAAKEIRAEARVFADIGAGFEVVKRDADGIYYVLSAPGRSIAIYDSDGERRGQFPNESSQGATIVSAEDIDFDSSGRMLVADQGANAVKIFSPEGTLDATIPLASPSSIAPLVNGEFAVAALGETPTINIYDAQGKRVRTFSSLPASARQFALTHYKSVGLMCGDLAGHIYFAYAFLPEPIIRKYDRYGAAIYEIPLTSDAILPETFGQQQPAEKRAINAIAVDPATQEVWAALGDRLLHFNKDGARRGAYRTVTPEGVPLEARAIVIEQDRILLGANPAGVFAFARPDRPQSAAPPSPATTEPPASQQETPPEEHPRVPPPAPPPLPPAEPPPH